MAEAMTTDTAALQERIARALYVESCEEEDGGLTWETEESVAEEIESWERFAAAVMSVVTPVLAEVYDEGYEDAQHDEHEHRPWRKSTHPYRQEQ